MSLELLLDAAIFLEQQEVVICKGDAPKSGALELKTPCPPSNYAPTTALPVELPSPTSSISGGMCYDTLLPSPAPTPSPTVSRRRGSSSPYSLSGSLPPNHPICASPFKEVVGVDGPPAQQLDDYLDSSPTFFNGLSQNGGAKGFTLDYEEQQREEAKRRAGTPSREVHNKLEKNRRAHLKECFENLRRQLPCMEDKKISNQTILKASQKFITNLKRKERDHEHEMERLARQKIANQQHLAQLKKDLQTKWDHIDFSLILPANLEEQKDNQTKSTTTASEQPDLIDEKSSNESSYTSSMMTSSPDSKYKGYKVFTEARDYNDVNNQVGLKKSALDLSESKNVVKKELKAEDLNEAYVDPNQPLNLSLNPVESVTVLPVLEQSQKIKENSISPRNACAKSKVKYKDEWPHRSKQFQPYYIDDKSKISKVNFGLSGISAVNSSSVLSKVSGVNVNVTKVVSTTTASNINQLGSIISSNGLNALKTIRNGSVTHFSHLVKSATGTALTPIPTVGKLTVAVSNTPGIRINNASNGTFTSNGIQLQPIGKISANGIGPGPGLATLSVVPSNGQGVPTTLAFGTLSMSTQQPRLATTIASTRMINTPILTPINSSYNVDSIGGSNHKGSFNNSIIGGASINSPIVTPIISTNVSSIGQSVPTSMTSATLARMVPANSSNTLSLSNGSIQIGQQLIAASGMQLASSGVQLNSSRASTVHLSSLPSGVQIGGPGAAGIQLGGANGLIGQPTAIQVITPEGYKIIPTDNTVNGKPLAITFAAHPDCLDPRALEEGKPLMVTVNKNGLSALHLTVPRHTNSSQSSNIVSSSSVPLNLAVSGSSGATVKMTQAGTTILPSYIPITHANGIAQLVPGMSLVGPLVVSQSQRGVTMVPVSTHAHLGGKAIKGSHQYTTTLVNSGIMPSTTPTSVSVMNSGLINSVVMVSAPHSVQLNASSVSTTSQPCITMNLKTSAN